jgi:hypothetical protein
MFNYRHAPNMSIQALRRTECGLMRGLALMHPYLPTFTAVKVITTAHFAKMLFELG